MARRRGPHLKVDMFPFLSVLCSVIGVLMLFMMIIISTRVIEAEEQNPVSNQQVDEGEQDVQDGIKTEEYKKLDKEIVTSRNLLDLRLREHADLRKKIRRLKDLIRTRKRQIALAGNNSQPGRRIGQPKKVQIVADKKYPIPGGLTPVFLEISSKGYRLQPDDILYSPVKKNGLIYTADAKFAAFIAKMAAESRSKYLILLIHPSGVTAYRNLRGYLRKGNQSRIVTTHRSLVWTRFWNFGSGIW